MGCTSPSWTLAKHLLWARSYLRALHKAPLSAAGQRRGNKVSLRWETGRYRWKWLFAMRNVKSLWEFREGQLCIPTKTIAYSLCLKIEYFSPLKQKWTSQLVSRPKKKKKQTYQSTESEMFLRGDEGQGEVPGSVWGKEKWRLNIPGLPSQWLSSWVVSYLRGFWGQIDTHPSHFK